MGGNNCKGCHVQKNGMVTGSECPTTGGPCPYQKEADSDCNPDDD